MNISHYKINLVANPANSFNQRVVEGIHHYISTSKHQFNVEIVSSIESLQNLVDSQRSCGLLVNFDDFNLSESQLLTLANKTVVGFGYSREPEYLYPIKSTVVNDNENLVETALNHLRQKGLTQFSYVSSLSKFQPEWTNIREKSFIKCLGKYHYHGHIFSANITCKTSYNELISLVTDWLKTQTTPLGIITATATEALMITQAASKLGLDIPKQLAVIAIDENSGYQHLSQVKLSTVEPGFKQIGYLATELLHQKLLLPYEKNTRIKVPAHQVIDAKSTGFSSSKDPYAVQAKYFIDSTACQGIKVDQVCDYVGISKSNLDVRYKKEFGKSMHRQIFDKKLNTCCDMLQNTKISISEIALKSGYPSAQYMYAIFKRNIGVTPLVYRQLSA